MSKDVHKLNYITRTIDLSVAHTDTEYKLPGFFDHLAVTFIRGSASIKLNEKTRDSINLERVKTIDKGVFDRFFLTNTAQTDAELELEIGGDQSFETQPSSRAECPYKDADIATQATTAGYATLGGTDGELWIGDLTEWVFELRETVGQNTMYQVQFSMDRTNWYTKKTDQDLVANGHKAESGSDKWRWLRVQIIDKVGGTHGSVLLNLHGEKM